ncbi:MAG TPA: cellulase family glycosylhydrolase [Capsulimonadaceae bacterium]
MTTAPRAALAACAAALSLAAFAPEPANAQQIAPATTAGFGINVHWWNPPKQDEIDRFVEGGFSLVRQDLNWARIEKTQGVYDFTPYDADIDIMLKNKIKPLIIFAYGNKMYDAGVSPHTDAGRAAFAAFAGASAARYKGHGILWEIWNEPNSNMFWQPKANADDYALLAIATAKAIRAADPTGVILAPASSRFPWDFYRTVFKYGLLHEIDAVSVHPYRVSEPEDAVGDYGRLRRLIGSYTAPGDAVKPIMCSEWGYSTEVGGIPLDKQARYLARVWLSNLEAGVGTSIWYDWRNDATSNPKDPEQNFGSVTNDFQPKPAFLLAKSLLHDLDGARFVHTLPTKVATDHRLLFAKGAALSVVSWSNDASATPEASTPSVRKLATSDTDYAELLQSAAIDYTGGVLVATPAHPAVLPLRVTNPDKKAATVIVTVAGIAKTLQVAPSATVSSSLALPVSVVSQGLETTLPVTATWNGKPVPNLAPIKVDAGYPVTMTAAATPSGIGVDISQLNGQTFKGTLRLTVAGKATSTPVAVPTGSSARTMLTCDPGVPTVIEAVDATGVVMARLGPLKFVPVPGFAVVPGAKTEFSKMRAGKTPPNLWQVATTEPTAASDPIAAAVTAPYGDVPDWQSSQIGPMKNIAIPDGTSALTFWLDYKSIPGVTECGRFIDSTGQNFQAAYAPSSTSGWRVQTMPLDGEMWHWGGAKDGQIRGPLSLSALYLIATHGAITSTGTLRIGAPYFAIGQPVTPDAPH